MSRDRNLIKNLVELSINKKLGENDDFIRYSFYEIRVALDLSEEETQIFLELAKNKLENMNFLVFFTGSKFTYGEASRTVQDNELMIAVKEN